MVSFGVADCLSGIVELVEAGSFGIVVSFLATGLLVGMVVFGNSGNSGIGIWCLCIRNHFWLSGHFVGTVWVGTVWVDSGVDLVRNVGMGTFDVYQVRIVFSFFVSPCLLRQSLLFV